MIGQVYEVPRIDFPKVELARRTPHTGKKGSRIANRPKRAKRKKELWTLYLLELEDRCFYVGITRNIKKRFKTHSRGKGANWTKLHRPIRVLHSKEIGLLTTSQAAAIENGFTMEVATHYGTSYVRGGSHCAINYF